MKGMSSVNLNVAGLYKIWRYNRLSLTEKAAGRGVKQVGQRQAAMSNVVFTDQAPWMSTPHPNCKY